MVASEKVDPWYQMLVRAPEEADPVALIKHCESFLDRMTCIIEIYPETEGVVRPDGTIGIRGYNEYGFVFAKRHLQEQGFTIEDERVNE